VNDGRIKNYAFGLKGRLPDNVLGKNWSWSANASHGDSLYSIKTVNNIVRQKFRASINTIRNAGGTIVCNPNSLSYLSLSAVDQAACVPSNPIGPNSFSPAAIAYFEGMLVESPNLKLDEVTASAQFDPFSTWAGAVTLFAGAEWRKEQMNTYVDDIANLAAVTTDFGQTAQGGYMYINPKSIAASPNTVTEVFGETLIPLAKDLPFVKSFGLDLAARSTNYKLSGKVTSYKGSFLYSPIDGLLIRGTNSRDIRAPALAEYFAATNTQAVNFVPNTTSFDPQQPTKAYSALGLQGGNRNLTPETATTLTLGISYSPAFVEGLSASVDYYSIKIKQAIGTIATQVILDGCGNGTLATGTTFVAGTASNPFFCNYITRAGGPNTATDIISLNAGQLLNVGLIINKGVDFELAYRVALSRLMSRLKGNMSFRVLANRIDVNNDTQSFPGGPFAISTLATLGNPRWKGTANLGYQNGPLSLNMQGTYTSGMRNLTVSPANATTIAANSFSDPSVLRIPARWYLNLTAQYALIDKGSEQLEATINVRNLFDTNPIIGFATATSASPIGLGGFDTIGRAYNLGLRFKF
jgi:outer membrane receptor protein involved in Fe transport